MACAGRAAHAPAANQHLTPLTPVHAYRNGVGDYKLYQALREPRRILEDTVKSSFQTPNLVHHERDAISL